MPRTRNERQHLTERYQAKQIKRAGPFKDYHRRPEDTFWWELQGYDIYPRWDWDAPSTPLTDERLGYFRNHSPWSCSCHRCMNGWDKWSEGEMYIKRKIYQQDQDYREWLEEYKRHNSSFRPIL